MYVLLSRSGTNDRFYPADRCTYHTVPDPDGNGYLVSISPAPQFFPGDAAAADIPGADTAGTRAQLGYIGKSGRFVAITDV